MKQPLTLYHPKVVDTLFNIFKKPGGAGFEGLFHSMYRDRRRLVTIGVGFIVDVDPKRYGGSKSKAEAAGIGMALRVFARARGSAKSNERSLPADLRARITKEWKKIKDHGGFGKIKLSDEDIRNEFHYRAGRFWGALVKTFPLRTWPADAQLGLLAITWGAGAGGIVYRYPRFRKACLKMEFDKAAKETKSKVRPQYLRLFYNCFMNGAWIMDPQGGGAKLSTHAKA